MPLLSHPHERTDLKHHYGFIAFVPRGSWATLRSKRMGESRRLSAGPSGATLGFHRRFGRSDHE